MARSWKLRASQFCVNSKAARSKGTLTVERSHKASGKLQVKLKVSSQTDSYQSKEKLAIITNLAVKKKVSSQTASYQSKELLAIKTKVTNQKKS